MDELDNTNLNKFQSKIINQDIMKSSNNHITKTENLNMDELAKTNSNRYQSKIVFKF